MAERKLSARAGADWQGALRLTVRNSTTATGWTLREQRGMARLEVRQQGHPRQSVQLPFAWSRNDVGAIVARVRNIDVLTLDGMDLASAAEAAKGRAPRGRLRRQEAIEGFRRQKLEHGAAIKPGPWDDGYQPVLSMAISLLSKTKPPRTPAELLDGCLRVRPQACGLNTSGSAHCPADQKTTVSIRDGLQQDPAPATAFYVEGLGPIHGLHPLVFIEPSADHHAAYSAERAITSARDLRD
ncbi:MAG: hypothetical protein WBN89_03405 [Prochlorococcaceae cyanobacterium]